MKKSILFTILACIIIATKSIAQTVPTYVPTNGLVGYWGFDGNANDYSGNGNNGTVNGASLITDRSGIANSAYYLNNNTITLNNSNGLLNFNNTSNFSISFWMKTNVLNEQRVYSKRFNYAGIEVIIVNDSIRFFYGDITNNFVWPPISHTHLTDNKWHHVVVILDRSINKIHCCIDGINQNLFADISSITGSINNTVTPFLGSDPNSITSYSNASYDDIGIWNRALTANEVTQLYSGCSGIPSASIIAIGSKTFCSGGDVPLRCTTTGTGYTYKWMKGANIIAGATSNTYNAKGSATYKCIVTNACGTSSATSNAITTTELANASVALTASGNISFCAGDSVTINASNPGANYTIQWYRNNISLLGSTALSYVAKQPGTFKVVSKNNVTGCSRISSGSIVTTVNCRMSNPNQTAGMMDNNTTEFNPINLFPNPNAGSFTFEYTGLQEEENGQAVVQLINSLGQQVYQFTVEIDNGKVFKELDLTGQIKNGIYLLKMEINGRVYNSKVMIN